MRKIVFCLAALLASSALAQDEKVDQILAKYDRIRPTAHELVMYQLDWADSLDDAQRRAAHEGRPIVLIIIHAQYGDILAGHC